MGALAFNLYKPKDTCCIVVGLGLIGQEISQQLGLYGEQIKAETASFSWDSASEIANSINHLIKNSGRKQLELIWSAGRAGFSATDDEMMKEYDIFTQTINNLAIEHGANLCVNFLSSAGGIYEGIENIHAIDDVNPVRPYGIWKLKHEELLSSLQIPARIYRISSAYGFARDASRSGLINNLIHSALTNKNTLIYATPYTLRDYVFTPDIARFIVENITNCHPSDTQILASGRSVSIDMLINSITQLIRKRVKVSYSANDSNSRDIVFPKLLLPNKLTITPMEESIRRIAMNRFFSQ